MPLSPCSLCLQGKWLAFRAASSGDRFLQARKRSPRLVFYNNNIGTWEQWELLDEAAAEQAPWARQAVTLKHRRLPQVGRMAACSFGGPPGGQKVFRRLGSSGSSSTQPSQSARPTAPLIEPLTHSACLQFELKVELVRVGTFTPGAGGPASITPRSVTMAQQEPEVSENVQLKKMSGVLMHVRPAQRCPANGCLPALHCLLFRADGMRPAAQQRFG